MTDFYVTGFANTLDDGGDAIQVGQAALTLEDSRELLEESESVEEIRLFEAVTGKTLHRYRLVDEGPVLDLFHAGK